jgi:hypothetical protein
MMGKIRDWFTVSRRRAVYSLVVAVVPLLVAVGWVGPAQVEPVLTLAAVALQILAGALQLTHLSPAGAATWFRRSGRAAIYTLALVAAPAAAALGWIADADQIVSAVSALLSVGAAILGVVYIEPGQDLASV